MAAATTAILGIGMAGLQVAKGIKDTKNAKRELSEYERQELDNAYKDIQISTFGSDLLREENARTSAGLTDAARNGGSRSIIGAIPKVVGATNEINQQAAKLIDGQVIERDYAIAGGEIRNQAIRERRDEQNIGALGSQVMAGEQNTWSGMMGMASGLGNLSRTLSADSQDSENSEERQAQEGFEGRNNTPLSTALPTASLPTFGQQYSLPKLSNNRDMWDVADYGMDSKFNRRF